MRHIGQVRLRWYAALAVTERNVDREYERMGRAFERGRQQQRARQSCIGCLIILGTALALSTCLANRAPSQATPTPAPIVGQPPSPVRVATLTPRVVFVGTPPR